jgi:hypothetical protein
MRISPDNGFEINLPISPPANRSQIDEWFHIDAFESGIEPGIEQEMT